MQLTDREKYIISTLIINKEQVYILGEFKRAEILREYGKVFEKDYTNEKSGFELQNFFNGIILEERQFKEIINAEFKGFKCNYIKKVSDFTNDERLIFYTVSLSLVLGLPLEVNARIKQMVMINLEVKDDTEKFNLIQEQITETFNFISFILNKL